MIIFIVHAVLTLAWCAVSGRFDILNLLLGAVIAYMVVIAARPVLPPSRSYSFPWRLVWYLTRLLVDLVVASNRLVGDVLTPQDRFQPRVVAVPLTSLSDAEITLFANSISLTPGTLSIDVSEDRQWLTVHAMYAEDVDDTICELTTVKQRRVLELLQPHRLQEES